MFVQIETTPNPNSLKFLPGKTVSNCGSLEVTNKDQDFWDKVSQHDTYLTAEECLDYGIVDEII